MSYRMTNWNGNTQKWQSFTNDIVSPLKPFFKVKNVNESASRPLTIHVLLVSIEASDIEIWIVKIANFYDFRFYTLFRRALLPGVHT